jgi:hypothetical protein
MLLVVFFAAVMPFTVVAWCVNPNASDTSAALIATCQPFVTYVYYVETDAVAIANRAADATMVMSSLLSL